MESKASRFTTVSSSNPNRQAKLVTCRPIALNSYRGVGEREREYGASPNSTVLDAQCEGMCKLVGESDKLR